MFLALWYYLCGYVMIKASGFGAERFMNMLSYRGVYLWDVKMKGAGVFMKVPLDAMDMVEACQEKTGCRLEILSYGGLPSKLKRFQGRQVLLSGVLLFAVGLYTLSSFVWTIQIEGAERLDSEEIRTYCETLGLKAGAWKRNIETDALTKSLLLHFPDISWVSVGINGTDATIRLAETIEKTEVIDKETPTDMIASADGVITKITVERGTPKVTEGDVVQKGDLLISSEVIIGLEGEEQHPEYVASEGVVEARLWLTQAAELPFAYEEKIYLPETEQNHALIILGKEIDFVRPTEDGLVEKETTSEQTLGLGDFTLPITLKTENYLPYEIKAYERSVDEAKSELEEILSQKIEQSVSEHGTIEEINITYHELTDKLTAEAQAIVVDRIGEKNNREEAIHEPNGENITDGQ